MSKSKKLYYLGKRLNPQLPKPYFMAYGQLSAAQAKKKTNCLYGAVVLECFESPIAYGARIVELEAQGFAIRQSITHT